MKSKNRLKQIITPYLFMLPALIMLSFFFFWPIINTLRLSFFEYNMMTAPEFIGISNFQNLLQDSKFWNALKNTILYSMMVIPSLVILPLGLAVLIDTNLKFINIFKVGYYFPRILSMVVVGTIWKFMYQSDGLINSFIKLFGFNPPSWLADSTYALIAIAIVTIWKSSGYYMVIYLAGLQTIPRQLYEAAKVDGASSWKQFYHITLPLLKPHILTVSLITTIGAMRVFGESFIITDGGPGGATEVVTLYVYKLAFEYFNMGYASTVALILLIIILILSFINFKIFSSKG